MNKKNNKGVIILGIVFVIMLSSCIFAYSLYVNRNKGQGTKSIDNEKKDKKNIVVKVVDNKNQLKEYNANVNADFLRQALEQIDGLEIEGEESSTGLYVKKVNGLVADYEKSKVYWSFYVNGEYCTNGVDTQKINDGDVFKIVYTEDGSK